MAERDGADLEPETTTETWREVLRGMMSMLPIVPGNVAWAAAFGAAATATGLSAAAATTMSAVAFSGTAQVAALGELRQPVVVVFLTSLLVSLRFAPMTLALPGLLPDAARWRRVLAACWLVDASFALVAAGRVRSSAALFGTFVVGYLSWVAGTAGAAVLAPLLPRVLLDASDGLIAVIFAVLAVEACRSRRDAVVAISGAGAVGLAMLAVPGPVALPVAALAATAVGVGWPRR
jgi:predicted branched-subunit amino acid permease